MQKFVNDQNNMVDESIIGFVKCYPDIVAHTDCPRTLKYKNAPVAGKVGVVSGGGWGHEPAFMGYIGKNMLTPSPSATLSPRLRWNRSAQPSGRRTRARASCASMAITQRTS